MKLSLSAAVCLILVLACLGSGQETSKFETRCGWLTNPTPANMWLQDRDAQWIIGMQGGYQLQGDTLAGVQTWAMGKNECWELWSWVRVPCTSRQ